MTALPQTRPQTHLEALTAHFHSHAEFEYGECDHGTYLGGTNHGEPYAMCVRSAETLLSSDALTGLLDQTRNQTLNDAADAWDASVASAIGVNPGRWLRDRANPAAPAPTPPPF